MRTRLLCLLLLALSGCAHPPAHSDRLRNENRESLQAFVEINRTTHTDILYRLGDPGFRGDYSDGRFSYIYSFSDFIDRSGGLATRIKAPGTAQHKLAVFIFSQGGTLLDWKYDDNFSFIQRSKYENLMNAENSEVYEQGKITASQFEDLQDGTQIGRVFGECGKPLHARDLEGAERWIYVDADDPDKHYYLYFERSGLVRKYRVKKTPYRSTSQP